MYTIQVIIIMLCCVLNTEISAQPGDTSHLLLSHQIFIRGIDNNLNNYKEMVINLSNTVELPYGTKFTLTDSEYTGTEGKNLWEHVNGGTSGISINYTGTTPIVKGSSICIVIPYKLPGITQGIQSIEVNGVTSTEFTYENIGIADDATAIIPNIKLNKSGFNHLYIIQSGWVQSGEQFQIQGNVIDGFISVPVGTNEANVPKPPSLSDQDIVHQTPVSFYAFVICDGLLYFCDVLELLNDDSNWTILAGSNGNDLDIEAICEEVCGISNCDGAIEFQEIPIEDICDYKICYGGGDFSVDLVISDIVIDGISLNGEAGFSFPYCWDYEENLGICVYSGPFSCDPSLPCVTDLIEDLAMWLTLNGYIYEDIFIEDDRGIWCLHIIQTDANFGVAYFTLEAYDLELVETIYNIDSTEYEYIYDTIYLGTTTYNYKLTGANCIYSLLRIVARPHDCEEPTFIWNTGATEDNITISPGYSYSVTVTCNDGCEYEKSGLVEVVNLSTIVKDQDIMSSPEKDFYIAEVEHLIDSTNLSVRIFPNPVKDKLFIEINSSFKNDHNLTILSTNGSLLYSDKFMIRNSSIIKEISTNWLYPGIYLVKISTDVDFRTKTFVVIQ